MNLKRIILISLGFVVLGGLTGCFDRTVDDQSIPWGRPASWEDQAPGMGGF